MPYKIDLSPIAGHEFLSMVDKLRMDGKIGEGKSLQDAKSEIGMVSEGINTCKILNKISNKHNIEMPICSEVYKILFENSDPKDSLYNLMTRSLKVEN